MKQKGALKQRDPLSFGQIIDNMADQLKAPTPRFNAFWNYKPIPLFMGGKSYSAVSENGFFRTRKKVRALIAGNRCIAGNTKIFDPVINTYRVVEETKSDFSVLAWNGKQLVPALAHKPFVKGFEQMYQVSFSNGQTLECTQDHMILLPSSQYASLSTLKVGDSVFLPESNSDITSIAPTCKRKVWDLEVPVYHNYLAAGVINHNSTKTYSALFELIMIFTGIVPPALQGIYPWEQTLKDCLPGGKHPRARRCRIIVQNYTTHWPTVIKPILLGGEQAVDTGLLPEGWDNWDPDAHMFTGPDGSMLHIYSADPRESVDPVYLRGGQFDITVIDEPNTEPVFTESVARTIAVPHGLGFVTIEYCPQDGFEAWHYKQIYLKAYDPKNYEPMTPREQDPSLFVQVATPMDNPSVTPEGLAALKAACKPWEVEARVYGRYSAIGENSYFPVGILSQWQVKPELNGPYEYASVDTSDIEPDEAFFDGQVTYLTASDGDPDYLSQARPLWKIWHKPINNSKYIMTIDCSAGRKDSDYQVADIWNATDYAKPFQVAQLRIQQLTILEFAYQCAAMGIFYGDILMAPEANTFGEAFIQAIRQYPNMYVRSVISSRIENPEDKKYGWSSNIHSKLNMLENLDEFIKKCQELNFIPFRTLDSLNEHMAYQERIRYDHYGNTKREWGAKSGMHDDTVTTAGIAIWVIRKEYDKITVSHPPSQVQKKHVDLHSQRMEKYSTGQRAFSGMLKHRKQSLVELRRARNINPGRRDHGR